MEKVRILLLPVILSGTILQACAAKNPFVWVESVSQKKVEEATNIIRRGDKIRIAVWNQNQISKETIVSDDGNIAVTLIGNVLVEGLTPTAAADLIAARLESGIVKDAHVTVEILSSLPRYVSVIGEVRTQGQYELKPGDSLIDVLARCGGLTDFADPNSIYLRRKKEPTPLIRFNYERLTGTGSGGANFHLENGDVIIVE